MPARSYFVYIVTNEYRNVLYTGVTGDLQHRTAQHADGHGSGFTSRYKTTELIYFERHTHVMDAIRREKQIKRWTRLKKLQLISTINPQMQTLSPTPYSSPPHVNK